MSKQSIKAERNSVVDMIDQGSIDDQAARWLARLDDDKPSAQTLAEFKQWVTQSPEHREAIESYVAVWGRMNVLSRLQPPRPGRALRYRPVWALASALVAAVFFAQLLFWPATEVHSTAVGEQRTVALQDGSLVQLNTNSRLEVHYSDERRMVRLIQGEAHFEVESKPNRPFEVHAGRGLVRAVGTAFAVHLRRDDVEVVVNEGLIEIASQQHAEGTPSRLLADPGKPPSASSPGDEMLLAAEDSRVAAGRVAVYDRHTATHMQMAELEHVEDRLSWRQGLLVFKDESLAQVVAEVSRYTDTRIVIPDKKLRGLKLAGQFKVGDTEALFEALALGLNIETRVVADKVVYLVLAKHE